VNTGIESLRAEHETILGVIDQFEGVACGSADGQASAAYVLAAIEFLRVFVDQNHHAKEERVLFAAMAADPGLAGMAEALTADHAEGRALVGEIDAAFRAGRPIDNLIVAYAAFIRDHIRRENEMVFEAAENALDESVLAGLHARFLEIENGVLGRDGSRRLLVSLEAATA
jgi:hemerythrin-like domain-containing protein